MKLKITVSGEMASGKTRLISAIAQMLANHPDFVVHEKHKTDHPKDQTEIFDAVVGCPTAENDGL